jgi:hypothetical protein
MIPLLILELAAHGIDLFLALPLLFLLYRQRRLFLNLSVLNISWADMRRAPPSERWAYAVHRWAFLWLALWHLGETVVLYAIRSTDLMLVVHHVLTVLLAAWIVLFQFYCVYSAIPLFFHYIVSGSNLLKALFGELPILFAVYPFYIATYLVVVAGGLLLNAYGHFDWLRGRKRHEMYFITLFTIIHVLNLLQFGFSTRISLGCNWGVQAVAALAGILIPAWTLWYCTQQALVRGSFSAWHAGIHVVEQMPLRTPLELAPLLRRSGSASPSRSPPQSTRSSEREPTPARPFPPSPDTS